MRWWRWPRRDGLGSLAINPLGFALVGVLATSYGAGPVLAVIVVLHVLVHLVLLVMPAIRAVGRPEATDTPAAETPAVEAQTPEVQTAATPGVEAPNPEAPATEKASN